MSRIFAVDSQNKSSLTPDYHQYFVLSKISAYSVIIPLVVGLFKLQQMSRSEKYWLYLMGVSLLVEIAGVFLIERYANNQYIYHVYTILEFTLISLFYAGVVQSRAFSWVIKGLILLFGGVVFFDNYFNGYTSMDNISTATESIVFLLYANILFFSLLKRPVYLNVAATPVFWLNSAVMLYFAGNLFIFIFSNYLETNSPKIFVQIWGIHSVLNIIFYLLITIAFWKTKRQ